MLAFHGSLHIPLEHVTNAYASDFEDLELQYRLEGTNWGLIKAAGVIETRGERFPKIAVQVSNGQDVNALAHEIMRAIPDSGPVD